MYVLNTEVFGYLLRPEQFTSLDEAISETLNWKLKTIGTCTCILILLIGYILYFI